jgi:hypothetical protein
MLHVGIFPTFILHLNPTNLKPPLRLQSSCRAREILQNKLRKTNAKTKAKELAPLAGNAIDQINKIQTISATIVPFIYSYVTTDSRDKVAMKTLSEFEQASLPMNQLMTQFTAWLGTLAPKLDKVVANNESAAMHAFMLEAAEQSKYLMGEARSPGWSYP